MTAKLIFISTGLIDQHPKNPRHQVTVDQDMVDSVKEFGVLEPLNVVGAGGRYLLLMGHRRLTAAQAAGLAVVPAIVRDDLDTEAKQIETMLVENLHRTDLTAVEEADAYEQLTLLGVDVEEISATVGRSVSTVKDRLKLAGYATETKAAVHDGQITLEQASKLAELEEDHELHSAAIAATRDGLWWKVEQLRDKLKRQKRWAARLESWEAAGVPEVERPENGYARTLTGFRADDAAPNIDFDGYCIDRDGEPLGVISEELYERLQAAKAAAPVDETDEQREAREKREAEAAEWEAKRKAREEARERHEAGGKVRADVVADVFASVKLTKPQTALLRVMATALIWADDGQLDSRNWLVKNDGLAHDGNVWSISQEQIRVHLAKKTAPQLLTILARFSAEWVEVMYDFTDDHEIEHAGTVVAYLDVLQLAGHQPDDPTTEWRAAAEQAGTDDEQED